MTGEKSIITETLVSAKGLRKEYTQCLQEISVIKSSVSETEQVMVK